MKKRSRESMLFDSEKVNHKINGILESPKKDGIKKSKVSVVSYASFKILMHYLIDMLLYIQIGL
ncbi:hypothetical protein AHAS_Ahas17G0004900 [Arachis hypogaea]